jgi:hypothetical protein
MGSVVPKRFEVSKDVFEHGEDGDWRRDRHVGTDADDAPWGPL